MKKCFGIVRRFRFSPLFPVATGSRIYRAERARAAISRDPFTRTAAGE